MACSGVPALVGAEDALPRTQPHSREQLLAYYKLYFRWETCTGHYLFSIFKGTMPRHFESLFTLIYPVLRHVNRCKQKDTFLGRIVLLQDCLARSRWVFSGKDG